MRFACFSDTHGCHRPKIIDPIDGILHAGDLCDCGGDKTIPSNPKVLTWKEGSIWAVRGNHDCGSEADSVFQSMDVSGLVTQLAHGLWLVGIGWHGEYYFDLPLDRDLVKVADDVLRQCLAKMANGDRSILLTHYPPAIPGQNLSGQGQHWFHKAVFNVAEAIRPSVVIAGHLHDLQNPWKPSYFLEFAGVSIPVVIPGPQGIMLSIDEKGTIGLDYLKTEDLEEP